MHLSLGPTMQTSEGGLEREDWKGKTGKGRLEREDWKDEMS